VNCRVVHVIANEDFGLVPAPKETTSVQVEKGTCRKCGRESRVFRCSRCGTYFCGGEQ
jgi:uncharacterized UBP type Zn finger protein